MHTSTESVHVVQLRQLISLELLSTLGELGELISAAGIQSQCAAGREARERDGGEKKQQNKNKKKHCLATLSPSFPLLPLSAHTLSDAQTPIQACQVTCRFVSFTNA